MITLEKAKKAIEASEAKAKELKTTVTTAIVDEHGVLIALSRMDGALIISPRFAKRKAYTAAVLKLPTEQIAPYALEGKPYFSINTSFNGDILLIAGGLPVKKGDAVIGGVGVGGSMDVSQDALCAEEAVKALA
jgi:uncharacterized protein GlcG (DUF336 family)